MKLEIKNQAEIIQETDDYAVVFKPPKMHCAPGEYSYTLIDWYKANSVHVFDIVHRLDYETHGLVLFAKNEKSFNFLKDLQDKGEFIKEYSAVCVQIDSSLPSGFPSCDFNCSSPYIESFFRPFGLGRKLVRPLIDEAKKHKETAKDKGRLYKTEIVNFNNNDNIFTVRIKRGFRHQIRCHLCWIGYPILNDPLYPDVAEPVEAVEATLALRAHALIFADPANGEKKECKIEHI